MKKLAVYSAVLALAVVMMPMFLGSAVKAGQSPAGNAAVQSPGVQTLESAQTKSDDETILTVLDYGETRTSTMAEYLPCAVAAEMPANFEAEALKAQAVAARTYAVYCTTHRKAKHPDADICTNSSCCLAYSDETKLRAAWGENYDDNMAKIRAAVSATDGQILCSDGAAILAAFHSSSAGKTESGAEIWSDVPYLKSVSSPETADDVPNYVSAVTVSADSFKESVLGVCPGCDLSGDASGWVGETDDDGSGRVRSVVIGGQAVSGTELRSAFSLRSTAFKLEYSGGDFTFTVTGYGHGLGMSQYGANVMARKGFTYEEILGHYYPDTVLE